MRNLREQEPSLLKPDAFEGESPAISIFIEEGMELPSGMTAEDIEDAVRQAQQFVGQVFPLEVQIKEKVMCSSLEEVAGQAHLHAARIELSLRLAYVKAGNGIGRRGYTAGSAMQQLWATTFEETFHVARFVAGLCDLDSYYFPPAGSTNEELQRYTEQPEEKLVDDALNSGTLRRKFGPTASRMEKIVVHKRVKSVMRNTIEGIISRRLFDGSFERHL